MDDFAYIVNEETNKGFVCSNRKTGKGDDDIYSFEKSPIICKQFIKGTISESFTVPVNCGTNYFVEASKQGYKTTNKAVLTYITSGATIVLLGIGHELIVKENGLLKIKIGIIYFDLNKF